MASSIDVICFTNMTYHSGVEEIIDQLNLVRYSRHMDLESSVITLSALAQPTRLEVFRMLVRHEPEGMAAGEIAKKLNVPHNTMSTHLAILERAELISSQRHSRSIVYRVDLMSVHSLVVYLLKDCCDGRPELCQPLLDDLTPCCQPIGVQNV
jgi:ArsR family transcriptional regulator, arsenate/arsenite/antimonite-responsive transcriptional repressor